MKIVITGGAGFVGSSVACYLRRLNSELDVICIDNLKRRGSELNIEKLKASGAKFQHGDVRIRSDIESIGDFDVLIECSAEPSVLAGVNNSPAYVLDTNIQGTINCLECCRIYGAGIIFLSTSRVYPIDVLNELNFKEEETRFEWSDDQPVCGASRRGIAEDFPLGLNRSLYGATKLASELLIAEYGMNYGINYVINRCGLIAGAGQFGKTDQGVVTHWLASHQWEKPLYYFGYGSSGKQLRDVLNVQDLCDLLAMQVAKLPSFNGKTFNIGGGEFTVSLLELTELCREITGKKSPLEKTSENRPGDIRIYKTDITNIKNFCGWYPKKNIEDTLKETYDWLLENMHQLKGIFE